MVDRVHVTCCFCVGHLCLKKKKKRKGYKLIDNI